MMKLLSVFLRTQTQARDKINQHTHQGYEAGQHRLIRRPQNTSDFVRIIRYELNRVPNYPGAELTDLYCTYVTWTKNCILFETFSS